MVAVAFLSSLALTWIYLKAAKKLGIGQLIKEDGPDLHGYKRGTPTMGGIVFASVAAVCIALSGGHPSLWLSLVMFMALGAVDDLWSILKRDAYGMRAWMKLFIQIGLATFLTTLVEKDWLVIPGFGKVHLGIWYYPFLVLLITGTSNAVNLTDGLDGLASFISLTALVPMYTATALRGNPDTSALVMSASILGFLFFNIKPARLFMGDAGSLAIGAFLATFSALNDLEIPLALFGAVFVVETLSVILQVGSYKIRKKRIFLMAPLHHHFELLGWSEERIVFFFTALNAAASLLALGWLT